MNPTTTILIMLCYAVLLFFIIQKRKVRKKLANLLQLLNVELDPGKYVEEATAVMTQNKLDRYTIAIVNNNLATAYGQMGEYDKAIKIYKELLNDPKFRYDAVIHGQMAQMNLAKKSMPAAQKNWETFEATIPAKHESSLTRYIKSTKAQFALANGNYEESLSIHLELIESSQAIGEKVQFSYRLAETYEKLGKSDQQKEQLEYVVANGNKLHIAKLARKQLQKL